MSSDRKENAASSSQSFQVHLPLWFVGVTLLTSASFALSVGYVARRAMLSTPVPVPEAAASSSQAIRPLPEPVMNECKPIPPFVYTSKHFGTGVRMTTDTFLVRKSAQAMETCPAVAYNPNDQEDSSDQAVHRQHLLVDIKNVNGSFLNSESRLAQALVDLMQSAGLTLLSYHCHRLKPIGVSCAGVLMDRGHVSFHTWPIEGVITLDLFYAVPLSAADTGGATTSPSFQPLLTLITKMFGVPRRSALQPGGTKQAPPFVQWAYTNRGLVSTTSSAASSRDLNKYLLGWIEFEHKEQLVHQQTDWHSVQIYEVINPRFNMVETYQKSLADDGSYFATHAEFYRPDRLFYLDNVMHSRLYGEAVYHEALVHPALISHADPKRVAIIGGATGASLREVLKHTTVQTVTMIERDSTLVTVSRQYLPEWSDCSKLAGSTKSCFDDPKAELVVADPVAWFMERYGEGTTIVNDNQYDVIIMDIVDLDSVLLYDNPNFTQAMIRALRNKGVLVTQAGPELNRLDVAPRDFFATTKNEVKFTEHLQNNGIKAIRDYSEAHVNLMTPWRFRVAFKDRESLVLWYANQAEIELKIHNRIALLKAFDVHRSEEAKSALRFFDGATMMTYQFPSRLNEEIFCRTNPQAHLCDTQHGMDPFIENIPISWFEVRESSIPNAGRGVFFKKSVKKGMYIAAEELVQSLLVAPTTYELAWSMRNAAALETNNPFFKVLFSYIFGYGFSNTFFGATGYSVEPSILTFLNHGCNGTYSQGVPTSVTEMTADLQVMPPELAEYPTETYVYNPFVDRNHLVILHAGENTHKDCEAGTELLDNYLSHFSDEEWAEQVSNLRAYCLAQDVGEITRYQREEAAAKAAAAKKEATQEE